MAAEKLIIATRGSSLALAQTQWVMNRIKEQRPDLEVILSIIKTKGDKMLDTPLAMIGGKGLFVKEIEDSLLDGRADLAVHSLKDVPAELPPGLALTVTPEREDYRDVLITASGGGLDALRRGARVGTSSLRRQAQLLHLRPDLEVVPLRGNVETRLKKLAESGLDAVVLAAAGLSRLNLTHRVSRFLEPEVMLPAIGQGALALEARKDDARVSMLTAFLNHEPTALCVQAERAFLLVMEGGCQVPLAALGRLEGPRLTLTGMVSDSSGRRFYKEGLQGDVGRAEELGRTLAGKLLDQGGAEVLKEFYNQG